MSFAEATAYFDCISTCSETDAADESQAAETSFPSERAAHSVADLPASIAPSGELLPHLRGCGPVFISDPMSSIRSGTTSSVPPDFLPSSSVPPGQQPASPAHHLLGSDSILLNEMLAQFRVAQDTIAALSRHLQENNSLLEERTHDLNEIFRLRAELLSDRNDQTVLKDQLLNAQRELSQRDALLLRASRAELQVQILNLQTVKAEQQRQEERNQAEKKFNDAANLPSTQRKGQEQELSESKKLLLAEKDRVDRLRKDNAQQTTKLQQVKLELSESRRLVSTGSGRIDKMTKEFKEQAERHRRQLDNNAATLKEMSRRLQESESRERANLEQLASTKDQWAKSVAAWQEWKKSQEQRMQQAAQPYQTIMSFWPQVSRTSNGRTH